MDLRCREKMSEKRIVIKPDGFILQKMEKKTVDIAFNPSKREADLCAETKSVVAAVRFFWGEEISRKRYKRAVRKLEVLPKKISESVNETLKSVDFTVRFQDEEFVSDPEEPGIADAEYEIKVFYNRTRRLTLGLLGAPPVDNTVTCTPAVHMGFRGRLTAAEPASLQVSLQADDLSMSILPVRDTNRESSVAADVTPSIPSHQVCDNATQPDWILKPEQLIITASRNRGDNFQMTKFQIVNFLNRPLKFELSWPFHRVSVTPESGVVEPRSSSTVCMSLSAAVYHNLRDLPYIVIVQVTCDQKYNKLLYVKVREDVSSDASVDVSSNTLVPLYSVNPTPTPVLKQQKDSEPGLHVSTKEVIFQISSLGTKTEYIELTNRTCNPMQWIISSFAPAYVQGADSTWGVFWATYKVFYFPETVGCLPAFQTVKLPVQFTPLSKGKFSQYWDIQSKGDSQGEKQNQTVKVVVKGECNIQEDVLSISKGQTEKELKKTAPARHNPEHPVVIMDPRIIFATCSPGEVLTAKVEIKNLSKDVQHVLEVVHPKAPFKVKHSICSMKQYSQANFPVLFCPTESGTFKGVLIFRVDLGYSIPVQLEGQCV